MTTYSPGDGEVVDRGMRERDGASGMKILFGDKKIGGLKQARFS